jgi:AraC-like DNA-binding protein
VGLHLVTNGHVEVRASGRPHRFATGDAFLVEHGDILHAAAAEDTEVLSIVVPRDTLATVAPVPGEVRRISPSGALLAPTFAFARRAAETDADALSSLSSYYTERLLQEMVIGVAVEALNLQPARDSSDLFQKAGSVIEARLSDGTLSPRSVAEQVNISLRQLERVFQANGTTVERRIRTARVNYAVALLRDAAYDAMTVTTIARHAGFSNGSSLARALGREGYPPPARVRRTRHIRALHHEKAPRTTRLALIAT